MFVAIYVVLLVQMVPRLWACQIEFPARTVLHIALGMAFGTALLLKIVIVRYFRRLDQSLVPPLGTLLLVGSVVLIGFLASWPAGAASGLHRMSRSADRVGPSADSREPAADGAAHGGPDDDAQSVGECQQYRICNTGRCPVGITSQDPQLRARLLVDKSARRLENFLRVTTEELATLARLTGNDDVHRLSLADLCTTNSEISNHTEIAHV